MTFARREIFSAQEVGVYHCVTRCVRRAFLCGEDKLSGRSFEHRREWIRARLAKLVNIFAIEVVAYAVMSNHLHCLIRNRPDIAKDWTEQEVARRWRTLFPLRRNNGKAAIPSKAEIDAICLDDELVERYRARLSDISWFNRCMNENIARRANAEDDCTGRFWEGRFKCQRVFDVGAILACSAYIDLNPIRAGIAKTPENSRYTSVQDRINQSRKKRLPNSPSSHGPKLVSLEEISLKTVSTAEYISLVDTTGRLMLEGKGSIPDHLEPILERLKIEPQQWIETTKRLRINFKRIVGPAHCLKTAAKNARKNWFQGINSAKVVFPA